MDGRSISFLALQPLHVFQKGERNTTENSVGVQPHTPGEGLQPFTCRRPLTLGWILGALHPVTFWQRPTIA